MGTDLDITTPADNDVVADFPANERTERGKVETLITKEHYEGTSGNDRHKISIHSNQAALVAAIPENLTGNIALKYGSGAYGANAPLPLALSFNNGTRWYDIYGVPTGTILQCAFNPATPPDGFLECNGAAVVRATYADLFAVIGTAFDQQNGRAAPAGTDFRVPLLGGHGIIGLTPTKTGQMGWVRNISDLHNVYVSGTYSGTDRKIYLVEITAVGAPDTFRWSDDGGANWTISVPVAATNALSNGLTLNWQATAGHSVGDVWAFTADPDLATVGAAIGVSAFQLNEKELGNHDHDTTAYPVWKDTPTAVFDPFVAVGTFHQLVPLTAEGEEAHENTPQALVLGSIIKT